MNKIIVSSYMGSGSSAVTDLLSEYGNVANPNGSYEYIFMHCPNGLFDLEDKLLQGNNAVRSDEALRTFETTMQELYHNDFWWFGGYREKVSERFMEHVSSFISSICTATFKGFWYEQEKLSKPTWFMNRIKRKLGTSQVDLKSTTLRMAFPSDEAFFQESRRFIEAVLTDTSPNTERETILLDQLMLPHNLWRLPNYFGKDDTRAIVVSRDPRDVFTLNKYVWLPEDWPIPFPFNVEDFCVYYRAMRESEKTFDSSMVMRVRFEDLVFDYDNTVSAIEHFIGKPWLGEHSKKHSLFNPSISKMNTGVFNSNDEARKEAEYIAEHLEEFIYPFTPNEMTAGNLAKAF